MPVALLEAIRNAPCAGFCNVCGVWLRTDGVRLLQVASGQVPAAVVEASARARMTVIARLS